MLGFVGSMALFVAFASSLVSAVVLLVGRRMKSETGETLSWTGRLAAIITFVALFVACAVLVYCFLADDFTIQYVLDEHVSATGAMGLLYRVSGLWAGRQGSLLFWAFLIGLFGCLVSARRMNQPEPLDNMATLVIQLVLVGFVGVLLFSEENMPFVLTDSTYYDANGTLKTAAAYFGMNTLLQHWAMAIHPPTLFVGYAGLTVPFAYAMAALITNDARTEWVYRCERYALVAWLFLTLGIGLGAVWAYVVLGWGGYWGWDPVENASLLPWLVCVALVHSFSVYKKRGMFKKWAALCACLAFCFCILGTFISRSGIIESVHAFEGDSVSLVLFGTLIIASIGAGIAGCLVRRKSFVNDDGKGEIESLLSKDGAFYVNNLAMITLAVLLAYLTLAQALPEWLPFGGTSVASGVYNAVARPVGIAYLFMMAFCPLLSWGKTDKKAFWEKGRIPLLCAIGLFVVLLVFFFVRLLPAYEHTIALGGAAAELVLEQGPAAYYFALTILGFAVASLLVFNSAFQLINAWKAKAPLRRKLTSVGSGVSHAAMGVLLVGLIASSMYVTEESGYLPFDEQENTCTETFVVRDYELSFTTSAVDVADNGKDVIYSVEFDVAKNGTALGHIAPSVQQTMVTQQTKLNAAVITLPLEDLFVVYQGVSEENGLSLTVLVNPLIMLVWIGFGLLSLGIALGMFGLRRPAKQGQD